MARKRNIRRHRGQETPRWLTTYSDMVTLLLCLFILLYATGKSTPQEVQLILSAFSNSLGFFSGGQTLFKGRLEEMGLSLETLPSQTKGNFLSEAQKQAHSLFQPEIESDKIRVTEDERGVIISLLSADYFNPGSALLSPSIEDALKKASGLAQNLKRFVRVEGHSSPDEEAIIQGASKGENRIERSYQNSWDISTARAVNTAVFMQHQGVNASWMQTVGYGSYRPLDIVRAGTPEAAAHNRRVDLVLLTHKSVVRSPSQSRYRLPESPLPGTEQVIEDLRAP